MFDEEYFEISNILLDYNFNISSVGFSYWVTAIIQYRRTYFIYNNTIEEVYNTVAEIHKTTRDRVERGMRTARKTAENYINEHFECKKKITNKYLLNLLTHETLILKGVNYGK